VTACGSYTHKLSNSGGNVLRLEVLKEIAADSPVEIPCLIAKALGYVGQEAAIPETLSRPELAKTLIKVDAHPLGVFSKAGAATTPGV